MSEIRLLFSGALGRMGRAICPLLAAESDFVLAGEMDKGDDLAAKVAESGAEVVIDFTTPKSAMSNAQAILAAGAHGVIGTTGFTLEDLANLSKAAEEAGRGLLIAPNFSLGMVLMQRLADQAVKFFPRVEIVETHHEGKVDAPSGTALRTAERLAALGARPGPGPQDPSRGLAVGGVRVHSMRLSGIDARQEVHFGGEAESLVLRHDALSRACYFEGVAAAVRWIRGRSGLFHGLEAVLFDDEGTSG